MLGLTSSRPSDYSLVKERLFITTPTLMCSSRRDLFLSLNRSRSQLGRRILSSSPPLSTGVVRIFQRHRSTLLTDCKTPSQGRRQHCRDAFYRHLPTKTPAEKSSPLTAASSVASVALTATSSSKPHELKFKHQSEVQNRKVGEPTGADYAADDRFRQPPRFVSLFRASFRGADNRFTAVSGPGSRSAANFSSRRCGGQPRRPCVI